MQAKTKQKATLPAQDQAQNNAVNLHGAKEVIDHLRWVAYAPKTGRRNRSDPFHTAVDARFYMGRSSNASEVVCSVWIRTREGWQTTGKGTAGGYGYCKKSAAFDAAVRSAGVKLALDVHGSGMSAVSEAMDAIGAACGYGRCPRVEL